MAYIDFQRLFVRFKIVYYGPGLSGKSTNFEMLHDLTKEPLEQVVLGSIDGGETACDYMPLRLGKLRGIDTVFKLYSVPGQIRYQNTRRMVLKDVDGIVFVADSQEEAMVDNLESLEDLRVNLSAEGVSIHDLPLVFQYNKRDVPGAIPIEELNEKLNSKGWPWIMSSASNGVNVKETLTTIAMLVFSKAAERYDLIPEDETETEQERRRLVEEKISNAPREEPDEHEAQASTEQVSSPVSSPNLMEGVEHTGVQFPITKPPPSAVHNSVRPVQETIVYLMEERILCRLDDLEAMTQSVFERVTSPMGESVWEKLKEIEDQIGGGKDGKGSGRFAGSQDISGSVDRLIKTLEGLEAKAPLPSNEPIIDLLEHMKNSIKQMSEKASDPKSDELLARLGSLEVALQDHIVQSQDSERRIEDIVAHLGSTSVIPDDFMGDFEENLKVPNDVGDLLAMLEKFTADSGRDDLVEVAVTLREKIQDIPSRLPRVSLVPMEDLEDTAQVQLEQRKISTMIGEIREIVGGLAVEVDRVKRTFRTLRRDIQKDIKSQIASELSDYLQDVASRPPMGDPTGSEEDPSSPGRYRSVERSK